MIVIAGPCSAESREQLLTTVKELASNKAVALIRCGVWKPRTHPGGFEGAGERALEWIADARREYPSLRFCCEVATPKHVALALRYGIDALWVGARTTASPFAVEALAEALRGCDTEVMVKNPPHPDVDLWLGAIERIQSATKGDVAAIHRGFASYSGGPYRNNPLWEIPIELRRRRNDLPLLCDPSHIAGDAVLVHDVAQTALLLGFDGLMIEVHPSPPTALTDARQQITPDALRLLLESLTLPCTSQTTPVELRMLRTRIDDTDRQLLWLLHQRMEISKEIAAVKRRHNLTVLQSDRWGQLLKEVMRQAEEIGLDKDFVKQLFEKIHAESVRTQLDTP